MKGNKKNNIFIIIFIIIFVCYTAIYIMVNLGYYEYSNYEKKNFTEEQIKKFEEDIKNGVEIDTNKYFEKKNVIRNKQISLKISEFIGDISRESIKKIFKILNKVVET